MSTYVDSHTDTREGRAFPAYGPLDSLLGFVVFYVFVERATPTIVAVFATAVPGMPSSTVRLGLAMVLWFIFAVTVLDQVRRQLAALGVGSREDVDDSVRSRGVPSGTWVLLYLAVVLVGGTLAAVTFERAVAAGISLIHIVGTLDVGGFLPIEFVVMVVFFVSFGAATRALDRLLIGGLRAALPSQHDITPLR